jgi:hypothetical protein
MRCVLSPFLYFTRICVFWTICIYQAGPTPVTFLSPPSLHSSLSLRSPPPSLSLHLVLAGELHHRRMVRGRQLPPASKSRRQRSPLAPAPASWASTASSAATFVSFSFLCLNQLSSTIIFHSGELRHSCSSSTPHSSSPCFDILFKCFANKQNVNQSVTRRYATYGYGRMF